MLIPFSVYNLLYTLSRCVIILVGGQELAKNLFKKMLRPLLPLKVKIGGWVDASLVFITLF